MDTFQIRGNLAGHTASHAKFGLPRFTVVLATIWMFLNVWAERRRQRLALARLSDGMLRDIGLSRSAAGEEIRKPFWRS